MAIRLPIDVATRVSPELSEFIEALSRIIEAVIDDACVPHERTLGAVRRAMAGGLTASLVGLGTIDPDQDDILLGEIDNLIQRYGATVAAENFVRFE